MSWGVSPWVYPVWDSGFLGLVWLFPSPFWRRFQLLSPRVFSHGFSFFLLILGLLWFYCWGISHCHRVPLVCHYFKYVLPVPSGLKSFYWKSAVILMGIPLCVICCFSLAAFSICSLCLIFVNLINMCLGVFAFCLSCLGLSWFLGLVWLFPSPF